VLDTTLAHLCTLLSSSASFWVVATRQNSSSGKPKSPRIQVVLPEDLCLRLTALAEDESRTVSKGFSGTNREATGRLRLPLRTHIRRQRSNCATPWSRSKPVGCGAHRVGSGFTARINPRSSRIDAYSEDGIVLCTRNRWCIPWISQVMPPRQKSKHHGFAALTGKS
jgi:hypothetical protein